MVHELYKGSLNTDWIALGPKDDPTYYQQLIINENVNWFADKLQSYTTCASKYSGYLAFKWNSNDISNVPLNKEYENDIIICNTDGKIISQIEPNEMYSWNKSQFLYMNWTDEELLYVVYTDGQIVLYTALGILIENKHLFRNDIDLNTSIGGRDSSISLHERLSKDFLGDVAVGVYPNELGCVIVNSTNKMYLIQFNNNMNDIHIKVTPYPQLSIQKLDKILTILTIEPRFSKTKEYEFIIVTKYNCVIYRNNTRTDIIKFIPKYDDLLNNKLETNPELDINTLKEDINYNCVQCAYLSPNNQYIAFYAYTTYTFVYDLYMEKLINYNEWTDLKLPLKYFGWVGSDLLYYYWDRLGICIYDILPQNPVNNFHSFSYPTGSMLKLITEDDCLRIYTLYSVEIIRQVPSSLSNLYESPSIIDNNTYLYPAAQLYYSYKQYIDSRGGGSVVDTDIPLKEMVLYNGIYDCFKASEEEFSIDIQEDFLNVARYGLCFYNVNSSMSISRFLKDINNEAININDANKTISMIIRLLNSLRNPEIGLYMTYTELMSLGINALLRRLYERHLYSLAMEIATMFDIDTSSILVHWCISFIRKNVLMSCDDILAVVVHKINSFKTKEPIHYAQIAQAALLDNRRDLASMLIEHENSLEEQISMLLTLEEDELALAKAIKTDSTDYILQVILGLTASDGSNSLDIQQIYNFISKYTEISPLVLSYFKETNTAYYEQLIYLEQNYDLINEFHISALSHSLLDNQYQIVLDEMNQRKQEINKTFIFLQDQFDLEHKLIQVQEQLAQGNADVDIIGLSVIDTLYRIFSYQNNDLEHRFVKSFSITDKQYWATRCRYLSDKNDWDELFKFVSSKKKPCLSYEIIANFFIKGYQYDYAKPFLLKMSDNSYKLRLLIVSEQWSEASELAYKLRSKSDLYLMLKKVQDNEEIKSKILLFINKL